MSKQRIFIGFTLIVIFSFISSCTGVSRGLGTITANKYAEPRSGTVWVVPPPQLEPPPIEKKNIYISFRNISDAQMIDLTSELQNAARDQGWTIVQDPQTATYRLRASLRFVGEVEPESGGEKAARNMGIITGAAAGLGTGALVYGATDSYAAGGVAGISTGGLMAQGIANASRPREWAMIIDFVLEEYNDQPIEYALMRNTGSSTGDSAGTGSSRMTAGGSTSESNISSGSMTRTSNYFPHGVRLSAWANQMNMQEDEAMPFLRSRTERVVAQMLPM